MTLESSKKSWEEERYNKLESFDKILSEIEGATSREKMLWREIYDNAISDRAAANLCFLSLFPTLQNDHDKHIIGGDKLSKYIERMTRSNDQLIKLAELIQKSREKDESIDEEALYKQIEQGD